MDKVVVISGAGRGLGFSLVKQYIQLQDTIYAFDCRISNELKALGESYKKLKYYNCDISKDNDVIESTGEILEAGKKVDTIYNVAGSYSKEDLTSVAKTNLDLCIQLYNINALGALRICKSLWPLLQKGSVVVNISSEAGSIGAARRKGEYGYCMSKSAMNMFAKLLSNELWDIGGRVISFHPGWLRTALGGEAAFKSDRSVSPDKSAADIVNIVLNIDNIPRDQMYMTHTGELLPW
jgi:NAD(P)-dependent dehydrogenase (short-subunit alcohol dehydrogenase family)